MIIVLGLGANMNSTWGAPAETIPHAISLCGVSGISVKACSQLYETAPLGIDKQANFVNAVVLAQTAFEPFKLLKVVKSLERKPGLRKRERWGPRPLDIDVLDCQGRIINWPSIKQESLIPQTRQRIGRRRSPADRTAGRPTLVLPHPQLHLREFVLQPLVDILPHWHHPVTGETAEGLLKGLPLDSRNREGRVIRGGRLG